MTLNWAIYDLFALFINLKWDISFVKFPSSKTLDGFLSLLPSLFCALATLLIRTLPCFVWPNDDSN